MAYSDFLQRYVFSEGLYPPSMALILNLLLAFVMSFLADCTSPIHEIISKEPKFSVSILYPYNLNSILYFFARASELSHSTTLVPEPFSTPNVSENPITYATLRVFIILDALYSKMQHEQKSAFVLNEDVVRQANPDFIISQNTCEVCAAHTTHVGNVIHILNEKPKLHEMNPHTLEDVLESIENLARIVGLAERGANLVKLLRARILNVSKKCSTNMRRVMVLEWINPQYTAGHWVPDMVQAAGGINLISKSGERSRRTCIDEIVKANPDIIVIMACGFDAARSALEYAETLAKSKEWNALHAVKKWLHLCSGCGFIF